MHIHFLVHLCQEHVVFLIIETGNV
jgi:hypothetical protein